MFIQELSNNPRFFFAVCITVIVSICVHELSHGIVAIWFGDRTPVETEHMTLNPAVHMGLFSVIMLLLAGIAWGSMPVNPTRMRGRFAEACVAAAGPVSNVILALLALVSLGLWQRFDGRPTRDLDPMLQNLTYLLGVFGFVNFELAIFNLLPVPPLDGSRILAGVSRSFAHTLSAITMSGAYLSVFVMVFAFAGKIISPLAEKATMGVLLTVRGH